MNPHTFESIIVSVVLRWCIIYLSDLGGGGALDVSDFSTCSEDEEGELVL
jgi:hypothetical protein